ncbi:unnamed protein product [Lepeophtheirus salmonis]|uniref:beta-galactoside alpha-(2,6)-sialyltransferase n=2 Tax=Lepeophtheirus salmonis TaxID=72036 RepID=A0A7R8CMM2_LEPSM|nr:unnamed protein product [Lepeophtheirus salmonis]CAF2833408.1 unnamed protein product [Lepeophtheirus salmonis]
MSAHKKSFIIFGFFCALTFLNLLFISQKIIKYLEHEIVVNKNAIDDIVSRLLIKIDRKDSLSLQEQITANKRLLIKNGSFELSNTPAKELICDAKREIVFKYILKQDSLFQESKKNKAFMDKPLFENKVFEDCALVSNSGDLNGLGNGKLIDLHDMVMRFNFAPTDGYEADVGEKTSVRYSNSQPLRQDINIPFPESFYEASPQVFWDTAEYDTPLTTWRNKPFFKRFIERREKNASQIIHIQNSESVWSIFDWLQSEVKGIQYKTPPTTGFLGFILALHHCRRIRLFGFIPIFPPTKNCHYYSNITSDECIVWHPVSAEKLILLQLNEGSLQETYQHGFITVHGFPGVKC